MVRLLTALSVTTVCAESADFIDDLTKLSIRAIMFDGFALESMTKTFRRPNMAEIDEVLTVAASDVTRRIKIYEDGSLNPVRRTC